MPIINSVLQLRQDALLRAKRPFLARGCKTVRCQQCLLRASYCVCSQRPEPAHSQCAFLLLMYHGEMLKPSNTGRLIADLFPENYAFEWTRTHFDPALLALLARDDYAPIVVFPHQYAEESRCIHSLQAIPSLAPDGKKPLFIMLDGTWREAKKMFKSAYLADLPVLGIQPTGISRYHLREAYHRHQLCTVEVAIELLSLADELHNAEQLGQYFATFKHHYLASKANVPV